MLHADDEADDHHQDSDYYGNLITRCDSATGGLTSSDHGEYGDGRPSIGSYFEVMGARTAKYAHVSITNDGTNPTNSGKLTIAEQLKAIVKLGFPNMIERFSGFVPGFMLLVFVGSLGPDEIAGAGMGFMVGNVSGISIIIGFSLGLPPLASQSYGAGSFERCGLLLQRQLLLHLMVVVPPIAAMWWWSEAILLTLGQPPAIAALTAEFLLMRLPSLPLLCVSEDLSNFLKAQRVMVPTMVLMLVTNLASIPLSWYFIADCSRGGLGLGFKGGPIALTISNAVQCAAMCCMTRGWLGEDRTWPDWSFQAALSGWQEILAVSLPAAFMVWVEWWAFEVNLFLAGLLCSDPSDDRGSELLEATSSHHAGFRNTTAISTSLQRGLEGDGAEEITCLELDVFPVLSNTLALMFFLHFGFTIGASTQVGNLIGAGQPQQARVAAVANLVFVVSISLTAAASLFYNRQRWPMLFSNNAEVQAMVTKSIPVICMYMPLDALGPGALNTLLRTLNHVHAPAAINAVAFYVIGIPLGCYLSFGSPDMGIRGLWLGLIAGTAFMDSGLLSIFFRIDWGETARFARKRAMQDEGEEGGFESEGEGE